MTRTLVGVALALTLVLVGASALIRLSQTGLSCADWPRCYGREAPRAIGPKEVPIEVAIARVVHRLAASVVGLLVLALPFLSAADHRSGPERAARAIALVLTIGLALLGVYTPSELPAVAIANLLGGIALAGVLAWSWQRESPMPAAHYAARPDGASQDTSRRRPGARRRWAVIALAAVAVQIALGGLIAVRHAALACEPLRECMASLAAPDWRGLGLLADNASLGEAARRTVQASHRAFAFVALLALGAATVASWRGGGPRRAAAGGLAILLLAQVALGAALSPAGFPLAMAVAHNVIAALVVVTLARLLAMESLESVSRGARR